MGFRRLIALALLSAVWLVVCLTGPQLAMQWLEMDRPSVVVPPRLRGPQPVPSASTSADPWLLRDVATRDEEPPARIDVYGNEISRPVARYRVDDRGTLYEVHSPHTEVPKLPSPKL